MINSVDLASCEEAISYTFKNKEILIEALTHPSLKRLDNNIKHYQRLEFLGDKILGFVISEYLFKNLPDYDEGILSKKQSFLVSGVICLKVATSLNLDRFILTSESYEKLSSDIVNINVSQTKILQNVTESIIGAIYIDSGSQK
jgi:ribonuclease-3